jgi:hypothetical protein
MPGQVTGHLSGAFLAQRRACGPSMTTPSSTPRRTGEMIGSSNERLHERDARTDAIGG